MNLRINERIRISPVLVIGPDGNKLGVMPTEDARRRAQSHEMDLVEVSPQARPPVCRIMDYSKYKYEQSIKEKKQRQNQRATQQKEVQLSPVIQQHDIDVKVGQIRRFIEEGHKVFLRLEYRRRQNAHKDLGFEIIDKVLAAVADIAEPRNRPKLEGKVLSCLLDKVEKKQEN